MSGSVLKERHVLKWSSALSKGSAAEEISQVVQNKLWKRYGLALVVQRASRGKLYFDGRWQEAQRKKKKGAVLARFTDKGEVTWLHESDCKAPFATHKRHACFVRALRKTLSMSEQQWNAFAKACALNALLSLQDSQAAIEGVLGRLWDKGVFLLKFGKVADEIAIVAEGCTLFEAKTQAADNRRGQSSKKKARLEIAICMRPSERHAFCHRIKLEWKREKPSGRMCDCGCGLFESQLKNPSQPHCKPICVSPVTRICTFFQTKNVKEAMIDKQSSLVQYFGHFERGQVAYADFFEPEGTLCLFGSWAEAFAFAFRRQATSGRREREAYYKKTLRAVSGAIRKAKSERGTLYVACKNLLAARSRFTWAVYNVREPEQTTDALTAGFAQFVNQVAAKPGDKLKKIRKREGRNCRSFYALLWKNILLLDVANLVSTEIAASTPHVARLWEQISSSSSSSSGDTDSASAKAEGYSISETMNAMRNVLQHRLSWLFSEFEVEWLSGANSMPTLQALSYSAISNVAFRDPRFVGLEQLSAGYSRLARHFNRGGLMFGCLPELASGDMLCPFSSSSSEVARTLLEFDECMSYPSIMAQERSPSGFVKGYHAANDESGSGQLVSHDSQKNVHFEYLRTFYTIAKYVAAYPAVKIRQVYSRYTGGPGQFQVDGCPLDLLIVFTKLDAQGRELELPHYHAFNMHHSYSHGCPLDCFPPPKSYISGRTREELLARTKKVDDTHAAFFSALFAAKRASYTTVYDCHGESEFECPFTGTRRRTLKELFFAPTTDPWLRSLVEHFPHDKVLGRERLWDLVRNPNLRCFVVADGKVGGRHASKECQVGYVVTRRKGHLVAAHETQEPTLFDSSTLLFLRENKDFELGKIYHVLVFGTTAAYQPFFEKICRSRQEHSERGNDAVASLLKFVAVSFIGGTQSFSAVGKHITVRDAAKPMKQYSAVSQYRYRPVGPGFVQVTRTWTLDSPRAVAQIVGLSAVLLAKLKLLRRLHFIEGTCLPGAFRLAQINTDSILMAVAGDDLSSIVDPARREYFEAAKDSHFRDPPVPGFLKLQASKRNNWRLLLVGARTKHVFEEEEEEEEEASEKRKANSRSRSSRFSQQILRNIAKYRHLDHEYGRSNLWWTLPYGAN